MAALQDQLGLTPVAAGTVQQQLADAQKRVDAAGQKLAAAAGSAKSRAQAEVAAAKSSVVVNCARAAAGALGTLGSGSGELRGRLAAAVDEIKVLGPQCKTPFAST